jgi:hypothetical protein
MAIQIYDDVIQERVIPAIIQRPSFRVIIDQPLNVGDVIEVITKINGVQVSETIKYVPEDLPEDGKVIVATVSMALCDQKSANIPTANKQAENQTVTMNKTERLTKLEEINIIKKPEEEIIIKK